MNNGLVWSFFEYGLCLIEMIFLAMLLNDVIERKEYVPKYAMCAGIIGVSLIIYCLTWISIFSVLKMIILYGLCIVVAGVFYKAKLRVKIFWATVYYVSLCLIDIVSIYLVSYITKIDIVTVAFKTNWYRMIYCIFTKLILFILIKFIAKTTHKALGDVPDKFWKLIIGIFAVAIVSMIAIIKIGIILVGNEEAGLFLVIISMGIFILSIAVYQIFQYICSYFEKEKQYEIIEYQNKIMIQAALERDESHKEIRKIWHDFNNHISCIDMLLQMDNIKRAREYIGDMKINSEKVNFEIKTGNEIADAVINQKYMRAKKNAIQFDAKGFLGENMGINAVDLCALMSNALDNAIEANLQIKDEKARKIHVHIKPYKDYLLIEIINAVKEGIEDIENLKTTKKDKSNHGFGMLNMRKIVEKYDGYLEFNYKNNSFNLSIMLKILEK